MRKIMLVVFLTQVLCANSIIALAQDVPANPPKVPNQTIKKAKSSDSKGAASDQKVADVPDENTVKVKEDKPLEFKNKINLTGNKDDLTVQLKVNNGKIKVKEPSSDSPDINGNESGSVTLKGKEAQINRALMEFSYQGNTDFHGDDQLTVEKTDGTTTTTLLSQKITVTPVSDAPKITAPKVKSIEEDNWPEITDVKVSDADGDLKSVKLSVDKGQLEINSPKANPPNTTIDGDKSKTVTIEWDKKEKMTDPGLNFTYKTEKANSPGAYTLTVLSTDQKGASTKAEVPIRVTSATDDVCDWSKSGKEDYGGDLSKNWSAGTVATYSIVQYNLADKKASFNAKSAGFGISFRYYTDEKLTKFGKSPEFLNRKSIPNPKKNRAGYFRELAGKLPLVDDPYSEKFSEYAEGTEISDIPAGCRAQTSDLLNDGGKITARYSLSPTVYLFQDKDEDDLGIQLGLNLGFLNDIFTLGVGYNLSGDDAGEWFILFGPSFGFNF